MCSRTSSGIPLEVVASFAARFVDALLEPLDVGTRKRVDRVANANQGRVRVPRVGEQHAFGEWRRRQHLERGDQRFQVRGARARRHQGRTPARSRTRARPPACPRSVRQPSRPRQRRRLRTLPRRPPPAPRPQLRQRGQLRRRLPRPPLRRLPRRPRLPVRPRARTWAWRGLPRRRARARSSRAGDGPEPARARPRCGIARAGTTRASPPARHGAGRSSPATASGGAPGRRPGARPATASARAGCAPIRACRRCRWSRPTPGAGARRSSTRSSARRRCGPGSRSGSPRACRPGGAGGRD